MPFTDPFVANPYPYAFAVTIPGTTLPYEIVENFVSGVYTISWSGGGTLQVDFYNGNTFIGSASGTSSIIYNLAQSATKAVLWNSVSNVSVVLSLTALAAAPVSGVLNTYSASTTPGLIGDAYVVVVGGGGGGTAGTFGSGGGSGGITGGRVTLVGNEVLTIGNGGAPGANGGSTTFAGFTATGGGGSPNAVTPGAAGTPNGVAGGTYNASGGGSGNPTVAASSFFSFLNQGTTGSGGGGCNTGSPGTGGGSGIGTGGNGGDGDGASGTGFGSGGGGAGSLGSNGGSGMPGVVYVVTVA